MLVGQIIISYLNIPISNDSLKGRNNKVRVISHQAYGFRSVKECIPHHYHFIGDLPMPTSMH